MVADRIFKDGAALSFRWQWARDPTGKTCGELQQLQDRLQSFLFAGGASDSWTWILQGNGIFTTQALTTLVNERNRIPVHVEIDKRGVDLDSVRCPMCNNDSETVEHATLTCPFAKDLWSRIFHWWNGGTPQYSNLEDMFQGKTCPSNTNASKLWQATEWVTGYMLWRIRNLKVFEGKMWNAPMVLSEIQAKSFLWITSRSENLHLDWNTWLLHPSTFDDHG
ncbi:uncharacterized protein [Rutidosis leptorrhynchoides]|uniref:uncharacterized protein n=1 Tax=Rutidosis leptorrhynchoides TaxID=125765 RepID=UPI003A9A3D3F